MTNSVSSGWSMRYQSNYNQDSWQCFNYTGGAIKSAANQKILLDTITKEFGKYFTFYPVVNRSCQELNYCGGSAKKHNGGKLGTNYTWQSFEYGSCGNYANHFSFDTCHVFFGKICIMYQGSDLYDYGNNQTGL